MIILWTDYFVYLLIVLSVAYLFKVNRDAILFQSWKKVFSKPLNVMAAMILFFYILIGVLDSFHFKQTLSQERLDSSGIMSVLDVLLYPLASRMERTYSSPLAGVTHGWTKLGYAFLGSVLIGVALSIVLLLYGMKKSKKTWEAFMEEVWQGKRSFPWRSCLGTLLGIIFFIVLVNTFMFDSHPLGTNQIGEDVLYQSLKSIRTGLIIGTLTTLVTLPFAVFFGIVAGYFRGWIDDVIQYVYTTLSAIPAVLLIAAAVLVMQMMMDRHVHWFETTVQRADIRLLILCMILGITSWTSLCRLLRAETLKLSQMDYIQAARVLGVNHWKILSNHLVPNVMHIILITIALDFSGLVLAEAVLSYVGVGVDPTTYSWGMMINSARLELARVPVVWWSLTAAFVFMFILVLAANIFSDAVRDRFDPHYSTGKL